VLGYCPPDYIIQMFTFRLLSILFCIVVLPSCGDDIPVRDSLLESSIGIPRENISDHYFKRPNNYPSRRQQWALLETIHESPSNSEEITLYYTRRQIPKKNRASSRNQSNNDYWNKEHLWPRSFGLKGSKANNDLHNIVATDRSVNSSRGNKYFYNSFTQHHECEQCRVSTQTWEPPDIVKGDIARVAFYMALTYGDLEKEDNQLVLGKRKTIDTEKLTFGDLTTLIAWHCDDPVSDFELNRDEVIGAFQGNHNVFVHQSELANDIFLFKCD